MAARQVPSRFGWLRVAGPAAIIMCGVAAIAAAAAPAVQASEGDVFFETSVRPILAERCYQCHGDKAQQAGLRLDQRDAAMKGGEKGSAIVPGKPEASSLIRVVQYTGPVKMPPAGKLKPAEIETLSRWVRIGAPWPKTAAAPPASNTLEAGRKFWAFQPVRRPAVPAVKNPGWVKSPIDAFILARLEAKGLTPARYPDRRTLIRRATSDLTGLPPTPEEVEAFVNDRPPAAWAKVIDRLLASPAFGERWGRHWLDVVRYADSGDTRGLGGVTDITEAYRYRDWVVDALNRDLPYDHFVQNQIAGDLLGAEKPGAFSRSGQIATSLLAIGEWGTGDADKEKMMTDIVNDQVDVVSRAFMGLTVACARCHDHKFDPISNADYYGLAGIFFSSHIIPAPGDKTAGSPILHLPLESPADAQHRKEYEERTAALTAEINKLRQEQYAALIRKLQPETDRYLIAAWDYAHLPPPGQSLAGFAYERGLYDYAVRGWMQYLGGGDYRPMTAQARDVAGHPGVHTLRGEPDCPNVTANTTDQEVSILSFRLPPHSISMHPGPGNGVVVGWKSPITGTVAVRGKLSDADPVGGDGILWKIDRRSAGSLRELASGSIANGGAAAFGEQTAAVNVKAGDQIQVLVLPKGDYGFDTTVVDLTITGPGGATWNLAQDVLPDFPAGGNPHADRQGHPDVWRFLDMASSSRGKLSGESAAALSAWGEAAAAVESGTKDHAALEAAARDLARTFTAVDASSPFWIKDPADEKYLPEAARAALARAAGELAEFRKNPPPPVELSLGIMEGGVPTSRYAGIHDTEIQIRGSYTRLGPVIPRHFPVIIAGEQQPPLPKDHSGRLELARWIASPTHPLTARVAVNRIWLHLFGAGIVRTPGNFGKLGERPTHPELLDYLTSEFVKNGWSVKSAVRQIMLSAAYQQSSEPTAAALKADPDNRLFTRQNRRRLEAEELRDSLLAASGRLDRTMGGPATRDFNSPRRTLYQMTIRSDRSGFGPLFDAADPLSSVDVRTVSTVAPQALFMLNHPFVLEQTAALAKRIVGSGPTDDARIQNAYALLYGRPATAHEAQIGKGFLARARNAGDTDEKAWDEYAQILLCANEFMFVD